MRIDVRHPRFVHVVRLHRGSRLARHLTFGGALVLVGLALLARQQGWLAGHDFALVLPAALAWSGTVRLVFARDLAALAGALVRLALAAYFVVVIEHIGGWTWQSTWPVLLIGVGVLSVIRGLHESRRARGTPEDATW